MAIDNLQRARCERFGRIRNSSANFIYSFLNIILSYKHVFGISIAGSLSLISSVTASAAKGNIFRKSISSSSINLFFRVFIKMFLTSAAKFILQISLFIASLSTSFGMAEAFDKESLSNKKNYLWQGGNC